MTVRAVGLAAIACCALTACKPGPAGLESNLDCSALIGASTVLVQRRKAENDPVLAKRALVTSMTYLNAYAIPKGLTERDAFKDVLARRATLLETLPPAEIMSRARRCADRSPV